MVFVLILRSARDQNLADLDTSGRAVRLAIGTTHAGLEPISTSARKHLVDPQDVVWVHTDSHVKVFLPDEFREVLVRANSARLHRFGRQLDCNDVCR